MIWRTNFGLDQAYVAADPGLSLVSSAAAITPLLMVIDPRTMQIVSVDQGWSGKHPPTLFENAERDRPQ